MQQSLAFLIFILLALPADADRVYLQNGRVLEGVVSRHDPDSVTLDIGAGELTLPSSMVQRVERSASNLSQFHQRAARLATDDVGAWLELAQWAEQRGLLTKAHEVYRHVAALDPTNETAQTALGRVLLDGRWVDEADYYRSRGFLLYEGSWITPQEREARLVARLARAESEARLRETLARAWAAEAEARRAEADSRSPQPTAVYWGYPGVLPLYPAHLPVRPIHPMVRRVSPVSVPAQPVQPRPAVLPSSRTARGGLLAPSVSATQPSPGLVSGQRR